MSVVVGAETLKQPPSEFAVLPRSIRELMSRPSVHADGDHDVLINVERGGDALSNYVVDVVIRVGAIVEVGAECPLPLLGLKDAGKIGIMRNKSLELQFANAF